MESNKNLKGNYVTGFADGDGSFNVRVGRIKGETRWNVSARFTVGLHKKDKVLLEQMRSFFDGAGGIYKQGENALQYGVESLSALTNVIVPHFDAYPLLTQKRSDFELFKSVVKLINQKEHRTAEGLQEIVNLKASMNWGLPEELKEAFPNTQPTPRPVFLLTGTPDPNWLAGFTDSEGHFGVKVSKNAKSKLGVLVSLQGQRPWSQQSRDAELMRKIQSYFECGEIVSNRNNTELVVTKFSDISEKIIPFFDKYTLQGAKSLDFVSFCKAADIIKVKGHLTKEGLKEILLIQAGMNKWRPFLP